MSIPRKVKYRSDLFSSLFSEEHVQNALNEFGAVLNANNFQHVLEDILPQGSVLELVLSNISSEIPLNDWMVSIFPQDANLFLDSFTFKVLDKLSTFFLLQPSRSTQSAGFVRESVKFVNQAPQVLGALFAMTFVEELASPTSPTKSKANSQRQIKKLKKMSANGQYEDTLIKSNISVPQSKSEATEIAASILTRLRDIYEMYLNDIHSPATSKSIRDSCITYIAPITIVTHATPLQQADATPAAPTTETGPAPLLHLKLSHIYDTPDGFGQWNILLSARANGALRDYHRNNPRMYEIIRRKINDLSNGHFSYDNHKRLNGPKTEIPIYEAKMTGDLRLVYVVDCITSPTDNQREMQALKVFDFCTHAKMDHRLWDSVAGHFQSKGKEYRSRCLKRERRVGDNGDVYIPASFPAREEEDEEDEETNSFISDLVRQDNNELHSIITLEKYVALSKDLLESIEADRDVAFPFELSRYEKKIAEYPTSCYVLGRSGTGKTTTMLHKMLWVQRAYNLHTADTQRPRQVFVTRSTVLARKVEEHFSTYLAAGRIDTHSRPRSMSSASNDLINQNGYSSWRESKMTFKGLTDSDFPLFIPLEDLYYLLEGDIDWNGKPSISLGARFRPLAEHKGKSISFHRFLGEYWPTFSKRLTKAMNPALVFNEIIGVISGSEKTLASEHGYLSREQYLEDSTRAASSNFSQVQRGLIYDIFSLYLKLKYEKDDYDISDRSRTIIAAMKHGALVVRKVDHLYVDETQDNLLIDALVLRLLCRNPDGLFWAGDTAQTISAGSSFRFDDLKAFMHRVEQQRLKQQAKGKVVKQISHVPPHVFQLAINFRSHAGIVDCAHIIVEFIKRYFPHTIDVLKRERGVVEGAKPMFCSEFDSEQFKAGGILSSSNMNGDRIELGAQQCILVRDEAARERFLTEVGDIGLVVTLYDSKGLEFNDVILLNFFEDSQLTYDQWRVVLKLAPGVPYAPEFDSVKHAAICLELKSLYVAITRARNNLRIVDRSEKSEPMKILWERLGYITQASFQEAFKNFAVQSSHEDWIKRAKEFFDQEKYALSREAYLHGHSYRHAAVASAYSERERAQTTPVQLGRNKVNLRSERFVKAAEAFVRCAEEAEGEGGRKKYHLIVAECFEAADVLEKAVDYYRLSGNFTRAAILLRKQGLFDEVKEVMTVHSSDIDGDVLENLKDVVRLYYVSSKEYSKVHELFESPEEEIEYLEDRNLDLAQVDLYMKHGKIDKAAEVLLADERFGEAASLLIDEVYKDNNTSSSIDPIDAILCGLRTYITFGSDPRTNSNAEELLALSGKIPIDAWKSECLEELTTFKSMSNRDTKDLYDIADKLIARKYLSAALFVLDFIFTASPPQVSELHEVDTVGSILTYFSHYVELLHDAAFFWDPCNEDTQRLFGIMKADADTFSFRPQTLFAAFQANCPNYARMKALKKPDLVEVFRLCLKHRLHQRVVEENKSCRKAPVFDPCLRHVALNDCNQSLGPCVRPHITTDERWFRDWLRVHLLQIFIYDSVCHLEVPKDAMKEQLFWLKMFHVAINPPHHAMGSLSSVTAEFVQLMGKEFLVVKKWIRAVTAALDPGHHSTLTFLSEAMLASDLAFIFDRKEASIYISRSRFVQQDALHPVFLRGPDARNTLQELLLAFEGKGPSSLTMGVLFIRHVVEKKLNVDINVFCSFIEKICGLLVVHNTYTYNGGFHNVMLPRSWLKRIMNDFDRQDASTKEKNCFGLLLDPLKVLLRTLYFGGHHSKQLLFGSEYGTIPNGIRKICIARVCRVLGLLGYNITARWFREEILHIFKSLLPREHGGLPRLYSRYIYAENFYDLSLATRRSLIGSSLDEMISIKDCQKVQGPQAPILGVRLITYRTEKDLIDSLGLTGPTTSLDNIGTPDRNHGDGVQAHEPDEPSREEDATGHDTAEVVPRDKNYEPTTQIPEDFYSTHSDEEIKQAAIIQRIWRRALGRKRLRESSGLVGRTDRWFEKCLATSNEEKMHQMRNTSHYRVRYLGALPHLLACIDTLYDQLIAAKRTKVKAQLTRLAHEALDGLSERYTLLNAKIKVIARFRGLFGVDSTLHQRADVGELRDQVQSLQDILRDPKFPIDIVVDVKESLELVYRAILKRPKKPTAKKQKRPQLAMDDEEGLAYEDIPFTWESDEGTGSSEDL